MKNMQVIKASAGSGKTYTLAKKYIEQLLWEVNRETGASSLRKDSGYHEHILAITFTNKATDEMKSRIVKELYRLSQGESDYMKDFLKDHADAGEESIKEAARRALQDILFGYTTFNVSTIDSFFQVILRTFARELDRDYNYEIQLDDKYAIYQSVHDFLVDLGEGKIDRNLAKWVKSFIQEEVESNGDWNFFGQGMMGKLLSFAYIISKENFRAHHDEIREYLSDVGSGSGVSGINKFKQAVVAAKKEHQDHCQNFSATLSKFFLDHHFDTGAIKMAVIKKLLNQEELTTYNLVTLKGIDDESLVKSVFYVKNLDKNKAQDAGGEFATLIQDFLAHFEYAKVFDSLVKNIWKLGLLGQIDQKLEQFRKDNNTILLADTNELITKVLDSGVDFVYERVGTWINHFMIDEFQDTSRKQYENFKPLLDESLGAGNSNLIIGDEKQCIYRFRNSDPDLLQSQLMQDFQENYNDSEKLDINYRSYEHIIDFNNKFFDLLLEKLNGVKTDTGAASETAATGIPLYPKLADTYKNLYQKYRHNSDNKIEIKDKKKRGYVRVQFIYTGTKAGLPCRCDEEGNRLNKDEQVLYDLPRYILKLKNERHFEFKDILILVNAHDDGNKVVQRLLEHNVTAAPHEHIELVSNESLLLKNSPSVRLIMSVLRFIDATQYSNFDEDGDKNENLATARYDDLTSGQKVLKRRLAEQYRYKVLHEFGKAVGQAHKGSDMGEILLKVFSDNAVTLSQPLDWQVKNFARELENVMPDKCTELTSLQGLIDKIIKEYLVTSGMVKGSETAFLLAFHGFVSDFLEQRTCGGTIHEFIKLWDAKKDKLSIPSGSDDNAIKVMTIHASKGLEAPCVIIPFAGWEMVKPDYLVWMERDQWLSGNDGHAPFAGIGHDENGNCIVPPLIPVENKFIEKIPEFQSYYNSLIQENIIDKVNKTYVAFTRASQELHMFALVGNGDVCEGDTLGKMLYTLMPQVNGVTTVKWNETHRDDHVDETYLDYCELGEIGQKNQKEDALAAASGNEAVEMPDYVVRSALPLLKVKLPDLVSDEVKDEGIRMHRLFSYIRHQGDVRRAMALGERRRLIQDGGYWTMSRVAGVVDTMFSDERTREWFAPENRVFNERPFLKPMTTAHRPVAHRPDRVVLRPSGEVLVIDYKFGEAHDAQVKRRYEKQVRCYMQLLKQSGYDRVKGFLWYLRLNEVVPVALSPNAHPNLA